MDEIKTSKPKVKRFVPKVPYKMTNTINGWMITINPNEDPAGHPFPATDIEVNMWLEILRLTEILNLAKGNVK